MAVATSTLLIAAGAGLAAGAAGLGVGAMMSKDKGSSSAPMQMPQAPAAPTIEAASDKAQMRADERKRMIARSKSVVSNPLGLQDEAEVARKKLLGG